MFSVKDQLRELINNECLSVGGDFTLSIGVGSNYYFDCKKATLDGHGLNMIAKLFLEEIGKFPERPEAIAGLTIGADPIKSVISV